MADKTTENSSAVVSEEDLLKSIQALETKPEATKEAEVQPEIKTASLEKSATTAVTEGASDKLKKALDVSEALTEIVGLFGAHIDASLEAMSKSVQGSAERDLAMVKVMGDLKKSIDGLGEQVKSFGDQPGAPASTKAPGATSSELLSKSTGMKGDAEVKPEILRKQISSGLESMAKSATVGSPEAQAYINAAIKYESTGQIADTMLREVQNFYKPTA